MATDKKKFMTGVYCDMHFICELKDDKYKCIAEYSEGNKTDMTFFSESTHYSPKYFDTLNEATKNKEQHNTRIRAQKEDDYFMGKTDASGNWREEF